MENNLEVALSSYLQGFTLPKVFEHDLKITSHLLDIKISSHLMSLVLNRLPINSLTCDTTLHLNAAEEIIYTSFQYMQITPLFTIDSHFYEILLQRSNILPKKQIGLFVNIN